MTTDLLERLPIVGHLPDELYLEVTNRCNLKCLTCPQSWGMEEESADLSPAQVEALIGQLPSLRRVVLHGIGEPTQNPELPAIIRAVTSVGPPGGNGRIILIGRVG